MPSQEYLFQLRKVNDYFDKLVVCHQFCDIFNQVKKNFPTKWSTSYEVDEVTQVATYTKTSPYSTLPRIVNGAAVIDETEDLSPEKRSISFSPEEINLFCQHIDTILIPKETHSRLKETLDFELQKDQWRLIQFPSRPGTFYLKVEAPSSWPHVTSDAQRAVERKRTSMMEKLSDWINCSQEIRAAGDQRCIAVAGQLLSLVQEIEETREHQRETNDHLNNSIKQ